METKKAAAPGEAGSRRKCTYSIHEAGRIVKPELMDERTILQARALLDYVKFFREWHVVKTHKIENAEFIRYLKTAMTKGLFEGFFGGELNINRLLNFIKREAARREVLCE